MTVTEAIAGRRSCRAFQPDPVPRAQLERLVEAARLAPSACNKQPWRLAVVTDAERRRALVARGIRAGGGMGWAAEAPALIALGFERSTVVHRLAVLLTTVDFPWMDLGIAGEHIALQAEELGLGTCWIGWIVARQVRTIVGWPVTVRPAALIAVGRPRATEREPPRTPRKSADEIARWL